MSLVPASFHFDASQAPGFAVSLQHVFDIVHCGARHFPQNRFDHRGDLQKLEPPFQERRDGDFVGGV